MTPNSRPLSPHLQVYRPQLTSMLSILHRITGFALSFGVIALVLWLLALSIGGECLTNVHDFWGSLFGKFFLLGWTFSFCYHFFNGMRHLSWDVGLGLEITTVYKSGWMVLMLSSVSTLFIFWLLGGF